MVISLGTFQPRMSLLEGAYLEEETHHEGVGHHPDKGSAVKTVPPESSARELSVRLHADQIGAMVVSSDGKSIDGIVTERDLAYGLAAHEASYQRSQFPD